MNHLIASNPVAKKEVVRDAFEEEDEEEKKNSIAADIQRKEARINNLRRDALQKSKDREVAINLNLNPTNLKTALKISKKGPTVQFE